ERRGQMLAIARHEQRAAADAACCFDRDAEKRGRVPIRGTGREDDRWSVSEESLQVFPGNSLRRIGRGSVQPRTRLAFLVAQHEAGEAKLRRPVRLRLSKPVGKQSQDALR